MGHYAAVWNFRAAAELTKGWNGIDQVVLRTPQGTLARVVLTKDVKDDLAEELGVAVEEINRICRLAGCLLAVLYGVNINSYCTWCPYVDCIPFTSWHCKDKETFCEHYIVSKSIF
ncbi:uncharacterized protein LOC131626478 isoform X3 [Vicia villosa]|uniref:uncharacterized protein LOC131602137 isoform X2 n=1 Tax=Vicia villosa TaxID=3911 RepID=UPI00273AB529|nr:uncharacterized protein LOC131602137 isoform X2 [Vicia villosa]XP_058753309.1 uncharacterized protein LOC131626478 isoform X3 [Vicia villosa]